MPTKPLADEVLLEAVRLGREHPTEALAAKAGGITVKQLSERRKRAAQRGLDGSVPRPAPPGFKVNRTNTLYDGKGSTILQWVRNDEEPSLADMVASITEGFADFEGRAKPVKAPALAKADLLTLTPCGDFHMGMYAWGDDAGENWDLKIAEAVIGRAVEEVVDRSPASKLAVVLSGGDLMHADNSFNQTSRSHNVLDVDGRYDKVLQVTTRLMVRNVDAHLAKHERVIVRVLKGNHDEHSSVAIAYFLLAWYRNEPRVTIDIDPSLFWWLRFGKVMLGATHGHTVKLSALPGIMAHRRAEDWGKSLFRYGHGFHVHHVSKIASEGGGCTCETHQAPIPQDNWHAGKGFLSGRSLQTITYHHDFGEHSRSRVAILDAANDNIPILKKKAA